VSGAKELQLGFVPLNDAAPLIVAAERGFFAGEGLEVHLSREVSWATVRDKVAAGALDGAHMLAPRPSPGLIVVLTFFASTRRPRSSFLRLRSRSLLDRSTSLEIGSQFIGHWVAFWSLPVATYCANCRYRFKFAILA